MTTRAPTSIHATLTDGGVERWADPYYAFTEEELRGTTMYAHAAFTRIARDWAENNPLRVSVIGTDICISTEPLAGGDGDDVLEFEVPLAAAIMTAPEWEIEDAAPLAALLRQLADKLEKTDG